MCGLVSVVIIAIRFVLRSFNGIRFLFSSVLGLRGGLRVQGCRLRLEFGPFDCRNGSGLCFRYAVAYSEWSLNSCVT